MVKIVFQRATQTQGTLVVLNLPLRTANADIGLIPSVPVPMKDYPAKEWKSLKSLK